MPSSLPRWSVLRRVTCPALLAAGFAVAALSGPAAAPAATASVVYLSPTGQGTACTQSAPCGTLLAGVAAAANGGIVIAAGGTYPSSVGSQKLDSPLGAPTKYLTVQSAVGQTAVFGSTVVSRPGMTFSHVTFNGLLRLSTGPAVVDTVHMIGGAGTGEILVRGAGITIKNSLIEGGYAHDGINIANSPNRAHDVLIEDNTIRDIGGDTATLTEHPDCIQVYDAYNVTIERNNLYDCYNSALTFSPGAHAGIDHVVVQSNFLQGCLPSRLRCNLSGGSSMDLRVPVGAGMVIAHNTFGTGSVRLPYHSTVYAPENIVNYLSVLNPCTTSFTDSLIGGYPTWACKNGVPGAYSTTSSGNMPGKATFVDQPNGNLHLALALPTITTHSAVGGGAPDTLDIDGQPLAADQPGADEPSSSMTSVVTGLVLRIAAARWTVRPR